MTVVKSINSAKYLLLALIGSIFAGETLIMLFIDILPYLSGGQKALLDAALLLILTFPLIYFLAFNPLKKYVIKLEQAENELFTINTILREHEKQLEVKNFELKRANLALKESNDKFTHLFDFAPVGYLVLTDKGVIIEVNLTGTMLLGLGKVDLLNKNMDDFLPADERTHWQSHAQSILTHGNKQSCKLIMQRNDKSVFYALLDCRRDDALISSHIHVSFTDITKQNWNSFQ